MWDQILLSSKPEVFKEDKSPRSSFSQQRYLSRKGPLNLLSPTQYVYIYSLWLALQWSNINWYNIGKKYKRMKLLFPFFITASSLSLYRVSIKKSATKCLEILLSAKDHGVREITVTTNKTKMVKNVFKWQTRPGQSMPTARLLARLPASSLISKI